MSFLDKLERSLGRFALPNLSLYLIIGQVFVLLTSMLNLIDPRKLVLVPTWVLQGDWWRVFSFMFLPPFPGRDIGYIFLAFAWYVFYLMGNALEAHWGAFRYNLYIFVSYALTVALSFIAPGNPYENTYILGTVLLAFAFLNPNFELLLFFILPVKIKWIALLTWVLNTVAFVLGNTATRLTVAASAVSFLLFFGGDLLNLRRNRARQSRRVAEKTAAAEEPRHRCHVCGRTDKSHPELDFRYCSKCAGDQCYCPEHIQNHSHVVAADDGKAQ